VRPLGSFKASLEAIEGPSRITVATIDGPLRINGQGTLAATGAIVFTGEARADATQAAALEPLLAALGPRRPDGAYTLDWRSR
jgi:general secretion pathway protein N